MSCDKNIAFCHVHSGAWSYKCKACWSHLDGKECDGMKQYPFIQVDIYEHTMYPVVQHRFYGKTVKEAEGYMAAHMRTDQFMRDAIKKGYWNDIPLQVKISKSYGD